jgi:drug/metabolite transporter (DMT)-like permease
MVLLYNVLAALINVVVVIAFKMLSINGVVTPSSAGLVRNLFGLLAFLPFILFQFIKNRDALFKYVPHKLNIWLGIFGGISMIIWPVVFINIETHIAMTFAFLLPFLANLMLKIFCKEEIPAIAWVSKVLCLIAVLIILRPQLPEWNIYHNLGLVCVIFWAISTVFQKKIGVSIAPAHITLYWYIFLAILLLLVMEYKRI